MPDRMSQKHVFFSFDLQSEKINLFIGFPEDFRYSDLYVEIKPLWESDRLLAYFVCIT
jgi:hypothetical protein